MFVDTHCHLDQLEDPAGAVVEALEAGVSRIVAVAMDGPSMRRVLALKREFPGVVLAGLGIHPMLVPQAAWPPDVDAGEADVIGEIGLDFKYPSEAQPGVLQQMLAIAEQVRRPVNLHSRRAMRETMEIAIDFTRRTGLGAQLHWFTHSKKLVRLCNAAGVYVSVGPSILTHEPSRAVAAAVDPDLLLLETDTPVSDARPSWIPRVAAVIAQQWGCDVEAVAHRTTANYDRYLAAR